MMAPPSSGTRRPAGRSARRSGTAIRSSASRSHATAGCSPPAAPIAGRGSGKPDPACPSARPCSMASPSSRSHSRPTADCWRPAAAIGSPRSGTSPAGGRSGRRAIAVRSATFGSRPMADRWRPAVRTAWCGSGARGTSGPNRELDTGAPLDGIVFGPKPGLIATWQADGTARVWDADSGRAITPPIPNGDAPLFSPDGKLLLNLGPEDHARLWDLATGRPWTRFSATRRRSSVRPSLPTAGSY